MNRFDLDPIEPETPEAIDEKLTEYETQEDIKHSMRFLIIATALNLTVSFALWITIVILKG